MRMTMTVEFSFSVPGQFLSWEPHEYQERIADYLNGTIITIEDEDIEVDVISFE